VVMDGGVVVSGNATASGAQLIVNTTEHTAVGVITDPSSSGEQFIGLTSSCSGVVTGNLRFWGAPHSVGIMSNSLLLGNSSLHDSSTGIAVSFGVIGRGEGSTQGRNIGVFGFTGSDFQIEMGLPPVYGAGIFGAVTAQQSSQDLDQAYAGFFAGDVKITTQLKVNTTTYSSDERYKQNIADVKPEESHTLFQLRPVSYNLVQQYTEYTDSTGNIVKLGVFDEKSQLFQNKHYGLIAQELQKLYPDLVYEDGNGYLSVDYVGLIPLLITNVQEVNSTVQELKAEIEVLKKALNMLIEQNKAPATTQQETVTKDCITL